MTNPKQIVREFQVYDGKLLDYALKDENNDQPVIFVEAKALKKSLKDPSFIAQTVNYANNEGVRWCVLANGRTYRIYRSVEPVPMERKMLVEVDLMCGEPLVQPWPAYAHLCAGRPRRAVRRCESGARGEESGTRRGLQFSDQEPRRFL